MDRRSFLAAAGATGVASLAGCVAGESSAKDYDVGMTAQTFEPAEVTVSAGDTVVWANTSARAHSVTAYEARIPDGASYFATGGYESEMAARDAWSNGKGAIKTGQQFTHAFEVPGEYHYFCVPHEAAGMKGVVVVEE
ncbi:MAG: plastocyanin/azurin family copper-binding protein [Haloferacaceae archaeon]